MSRHRAFIAAALPDAAVQDLQELQQRLKETLPGFHPGLSQNLHLTLLFLGDCTALELAEISRIVLSVGVRNRPCETQIEQLQLFGHGQRKRPLVATLSPTPQLRNLHHDLVGQLADKGEAREARRFRPHLTLGRIRPPLPAKRQLSAFEIAPLRLRLERIGLFTSRLLPQGAEHSLVTEALLTQPEN